MIKYSFYILKQISTTDKQGLSSGPIITKVPNHLVHFFEQKILNFKQGDGPFNSLRALKKNSVIFKNIASTNSKRAQKILKESNINEVKNFIATPKNQDYNPELIDLIDHCIRGRVSNGNITGVHFYDEDRVRILEITNKNIETGVWEAKFQYKHPFNHKWITKETESTFFPKNWNLTKLFQEVHFAYSEKVKFSNNKFRGITSQGIHIIFVYNNGKPKSVYPLL
ncbi:EndoU domain-containing protein [Aquimarina sp. W85]|uniref:EndoU domain-containing protein n=1 Tax=Aquimarina rhodophyticola TaxID=3342246 RepID=UPI003670F0FC